MSIIKRILYTSMIAGTAALLAPAISSSANSHTVNSTVRTTIVKPQHPSSHRSVRPVYGLLRHDYTDWTLNGKYPMWNKPANTGKRYHTMTRQQVRYAADHASNHAHNHEPSNDIFFLEATATYQHHKYPAYFYMTSSAHHGWVYTKGIRQVGPGPYGASIRVIHGNDDIYSPTQNHLTKHDFSDAKDLKAALIYDVLNNDWSDYTFNLASYRWDATHLGVRNHATRIKQLRLMHKAMRASWKVINHAHKSKAYYHHLKKIDAYHIDD